jgi:hypothetical protein
MLYRLGFLDRISAQITGKRNHSKMPSADFPTALSSPSQHALRSESCGCMRLLLRLVRPRYFFTYEIRYKSQQIKGTSLAAKNAKSGANSRNGPTRQFQRLRQASCASCGANEPSAAASRAAS